MWCWEKQRVCLALLDCKLSHAIAMATFEALTALFHVCARKEITDKRNKNERWIL